MNAWATLLANSTIETGNAGQHLQNQGGEGGDCEHLILTDGLELLVETTTFDVEVKQDNTEVMVDLATIEITIENTELEVLIDGN